MSRSRFTISLLTSTHSFFLCFIFERDSFVYLRWFISWRKIEWTSHCMITGYFAETENDTGVLFCAFMSKMKLQVVSFICVARENHMQVFVGICIRHVRYTYHVRGFYPWWICQYYVTLYFGTIVKLHAKKANIVSNAILAVADPGFLKRG